MLSNEARNLLVKTYERIPDAEKVALFDSHEQGQWKADTEDFKDEQVE